MKVLIIEDVQMARINMKRILEKEGFEVLEAGDATKALQIFKSEKPDVVSLDIQLPDKDGMDLLKEMKSIFQDTKFVVVTGLSSQFNLVESLKRGANHFFVKPLDLEKYAQVIKSYQE